MVTFSDTKNVKLGVAKVTLGGVDLGYTKGGVEVEVTTETHKTQVDQFGNTDINEFIEARNCMVRCPLAETILENMVQIMPGATLVEAGGAKATGAIDLGSVNATDGDTLTINGVKYTFKTAPDGDFEIEIAGSVADTLNNIQTKLAASTAPSVLKCVYTDDGASELTITYKIKSMDGNSFSHSSAITGGNWTHANAGVLAGGADSIKRVDVPTATGVSLLDSAKKLTLHPIAKADNDLSDDFVIPRANTAGALSFAYKLDEERIFNVEFTAYPDPDTKVLFKVGDTNA